MVIRKLALLGVLAAVQARESFHESLTLLPLPDGKLSVSFDFTTDFDDSAGYINTLTPPSLLLPLAYNNVSELTISFVAGKWDQLRSGETGPTQTEAGGGGGEIRGWLKDGDDSSERWTAITQALGGLFCAGLGPEDEESIKTFGHVYSPHGSTDGLTHRLLSTPYLPLCTENMTPFLSLLPSKGHSGLSSLLAQPGIVFSWGFKTEGIEVIMPSNGQPGRWRGWWEGVVDLVPEKGGSRAFSLGSLFKKGVPRVFPEASSSMLRLVQPKESIGFSMDPDSTDMKWIDGQARKVMQWNLLNERLHHQDIRVFWQGEGQFRYPRTIDPPPIVVQRTVTSPRAMDGIFTVTIRNNANIDREAIYSEIWPWWVKGWISEMQVRIDGQIQGDVLDSISYHPSTPPKPTTTSIHLSLTLPARSELVLTIPFTKLMLKYTEHRPDAERGRELSSGILTLLDLADDIESTKSVSDVLRSSRTRIYTPKLLLDIPTPDFSMPYNVIIMSSTVMAVFFGLMHGHLTRRWGWVLLSQAPVVRGGKRD